jgi:hypothetical protein
VAWVAFGPDGRRLVTSGPRGASVWELPRDDRPAEDLVSLAELLSQGRVDAVFGRVPLDEEALRRTWQAVGAAELLDAPKP